MADRVGRWLVVQVREEAGVATAGMPGAPVHEELCTVTDEDGWVWYDFTADELNQLWLTEITEHKSAEGRLYFCAIRDVFANRIVGYLIGSRMESSLAVRVLENVVVMRGDIAGCIVHSDSETVGVGVLGGLDPHSARRARMSVLGVLRGC